MKRNKLTGIAERLKILHEMQFSCSEGIVAPLMLHAGETKNPTSEQKLFRGDFENDLVMLSRLYYLRYRIEILCFIFFSKFSGLSFIL